MANYGYGYGNFTSQPQQYSAGSFGNQNAGTYAYTQPGTRVIQGYQTGTAAAYGAGYAQAAQVQAVPAASTGGYGYFQRASDQSNAYSQKTTNFSSSQGYGYGTQKAPAVYTATSAYPKPQGYGTTSSSYNSGGYSAAQRVVTSQGYNNSPYTKQKQNNTNTTKSVGGTHQNAYEKVVYNAATTFLTQQAQTSKPSWQKNEKPTFKLQNQKGNWQNRNPAGSKPQQLHYCEVCKISCAGPQTYKEHLEGQKHKKKAASTTTDTKNLAPGSYKCELCDVICTGRDAFGAHVKGTNHQKTLKLHQKLGKPIPEIKLPDEPPAKKANIVKTTPLKMNFVGGTKLTSTGEEKTDGAAGEGEAVTEQEIPPEAEAIGEEYVEDVKSDNGKVISYKCTLCDCRFNDYIARVAHVKGRRHRLSYKKKVDPKLKVDTKARSGTRGSRSGENRSQEAVWKQRQQEQMRWEQELRHREEELRRSEHEEYMRRANEDRYWTRPDRNRMHELEYYEWERRENYGEVPPMGMYPPQVPPPPTPDDKLIMAKHTDIYPMETELKQVQTTVAAVEKALKLVSDQIGDKPDAETTESSKDPATVEVKKEEKSNEEQTTTPAADPKTSETADPKSQNNRILKGVMRVGPLCTGLLLKGQLSVELVVLCADKPTYTLLTKVGKLVPEKLKEAAAEEKYNMAISISECTIVVSSTTEPKCIVTITLTSPAVREEEDDEKSGEKPVIKAEPVDDKDLLDKEKTLEALAALRHAKWFQARANQLTSCVITIRIIRDMCQRVAAFKPLSSWAIELLCEKALGSSFHPLAPGEAFRRVLESISSGIFLPGGNGILDPCEKDRIDAASNLSAQQREDITAAAQHALRLLAFRQLHKILGVEPLKLNPSRKRCADSTSEAQSDSKVAKKEE